MAELLLKVADAGRWEDGDVIEAFNNRRIRCVHAQHQCHPDKIGFNADGYRASGTVLQDWLEATRQYRFERVAESVTRIDLTDGTETDVSKEINAREFVRRRLAHPRHLIFGSDGREVWYGGNKDHSAKALDTVWSAIQAKTGQTAADFPRFPLGTEDVKAHLPIAVDDFDDATAADLTRPVYETYIHPDTGEEKRRSVKPRSKRVAWRDLFPLDIPPTTPADDVLDRSKAVDARKARAFSRAAIVLSK